MADIEGVVAGEYGKTIVLTCQDGEGVAQDISSYTGEKELVFRAPKNRKTIISTCDFNTTGTDGQLSFSFDSDNHPEIQGTWKGQAELNSAGALVKSYPFTMEVEEALR
jgi:hypothetical protein